MKKLRTKLANKKVYKMPQNNEKNCKKIAKKHVKPNKFDIFKKKN